MPGNVWTLTPKVCRKCGKEIYVTPEWVYKDGLKFYCSWTCFRHRNDGKQSKPKKGRPYKPVAQCNAEGEVIKIYKNAIDASVAVNGWPNAIYDACRLGKVYKNYLWRYIKDKNKRRKTDDEQTVETDICEPTTECD